MTWHLSEWRDVVTSNATCQKQVAGQTLFWHISSETFTQSRLFPKFSAWCSVMMTELLLNPSSGKRKGWGARRILKEFPARNWNLSSVSYQIKKIKDTGWTSRRQGSGRPRTAVNDDNKAHVEEMIVSQEDQPGTHKSQREISSDLNMSRTSVRRMTKELNLKPFKRIRVSRRDQKVKQKRNDRYSIAIKSGSQSGHSKRDLGLCVNRPGVTSITFSTEIGRWHLLGSPALHFSTCDFWFVAI